MQTPLEAIHEYYAAFSTLNLAAIVSYFCEPSLTMTPQSVLSAASHAVLTNSLTPVVDALRAKGYARSEFVQTDVTMLGEAAALVRGVAVRYTSSGSEMERLPLGYLMHRREAGWKIAVLVVAS